MSFYNEIFEFLSTQSIVDTHEHLPERCSDYELYCDTIAESFSQYIISDMVSAGMTASERDFIAGSAPLEKKWNIMEPYWLRSRNTGYARAVAAMAKGLYGIDNICADTIVDMDTAFHSLPKDKRCKYILKEKCLIERAFTCMEYHPEDYDRDLFVPVISIDDIFAPEKQDTISEIEQKSGVTVTTFDSYLQAADDYVDWLCKTKKYRVFKLFAAYYRSLSFPLSSRSDAEAEFASACATGLHRYEQSDNSSEYIDFGQHFQNYVLHRVLSRLEKYNVTVQIHTGLHEGNWNRITNSDPALLVDLFPMYRGIRFVLFHMSYPYTRMAIALTKHHPNVYLDMCWAHILSPRAARNTMLEFYDTAPWSKICGFGGDSTSADMVYGNLVVARENISEFLSVLRSKDMIDMSDAQELAWRLLYKNPSEILRLEENHA